MNPAAAAEMLRAAARITAQLSRSTSLEEGLAAAVGSLAAELGAARAEVWLRGKTAFALRASAGDAAIPTGPGVAHVTSTGEPCAARGLAAFPLRALGELEGVLVHAAAAPHDPATLDALSLVASVLALFIAHDRRAKESKLVFDSVPAMIWFKDDENRIIRCNRAAALTKGLAPESMEGRQTEDLYPDEAAQYLADDLEVIRSGRPKLGIVELHLTGSGEKVWVRTDKIPWRDETGAAAGVVVFATEITGLKRAEDALRAEKERLHATLGSCAEAIVATDERGCVTLLNPVAERLSGWTLEEALGRPLGSVILLETAGEDTLLRSRQGEARIVAASHAPIHDGERVVGEVIALRDVTETKRLEAELIKAAKVESIGLLAAAIVHDFNNILTSVLANASLARVTLGPASPAHGLIEEVERAAGRARELTGQLLTFAQGGAPARAPISLEALAAEGASRALEGTPVRLVLAFPGDLPPVFADRVQVGQLLRNLVVNARQAMPGGGTLTIGGESVAIDAEKARALRVPPGRYVRLTVADTGTGIEPAILGKIFDPFFTTRPGGTGLGLTSSYSIARRHDGAITCESEVGAGTRFSVLLPAATEPTRRETPRPSEPLDRSCAGRRALVMDDDDSVRVVLASMLGHLGLTVVDACDGEAAVSAYADALARGERFDVVVMDLTVPGGMGGRDAVQRILEIDPRAHVIVSSGYSDDPVMADPARYGFKGLVAKPFTIAEVARAVASLSRGVEGPAAGD
jgi:PAS domain S-box-containing protein